MTIINLETPAVLIDEVRALANISAYQAYCDEQGLVLRPHIKTHKLPYFARAQVEAGAIGITCQKISEAEVMAAGGIRDILITYNILGEDKLRRLVDLAGKLDHLAVVVDNETVINGLSGAFRDQQNPLDVLVECDTGAARCGAQSPQAAAQLAATLVAADGLNFAGLMTYPPIDGTEKVQAFMESAVALLQEQDINCPAISSGGTPDMWRAHEAPITSEVRVGTYIYNDRSLVERGSCDWQDCALTVVATVVSVPTENRAVIDAGSKILTSDLIGLENYGHVSGRPELTVNSLSEEHGVLTCADSDNIGLEVGEQIQIVPNHCCVVSNMVDRVALRRSSGDIDIIDVSARGCVT